jgi:hypothetical protein
MMKKLPQKHENTKLSPSQALLGTARKRSSASKIHMQEAELPIIPSQAGAWEEDEGGLHHPIAGAVHLTGGLHLLK